MKARQQQRMWRDRERRSWERKRGQQ